MNRSLIDVDQSPNESPTIPTVLNAISDLTPRNLRGRRPASVLIWINDPSRLQV